MITGVALVTGASRGIGRAAALALAGAGADVVGVARSGSALAELADGVAAAGRQYLPIEADLTDPVAITEVAARALAWQGEIGTLVNAAGLLVRKPEDDITVQEFDQTMALNVRAAFLLMREVGGTMHRGSGGAVVNVASIAGERVTGAPGPYQASKAAIIQLTRFYAHRFAPNVRVNAVGPGYVRTDLSRAWLDQPENEAWVVGRTPLGRIAEPDDIAGPICFLASSEASFITGQHLLVDGGWSVG